MKLKKLKMKLKNKSCNCKKCIGCCNHNCGWFGSIEEVKGAAKIMKMSLTEFAKEYLIEEWWSGNTDNDYKEISVVAPRRDFTRTPHISTKGVSHIIKEDAERNGKGFVRASWGHNLITGIPCIFLDDDNKCKIHESKPQECREAFGCEESKVKWGGREKITKYWKKNESFILRLKKAVEKQK